MKSSLEQRVTELENQVSMIIEAMSGLKQNVSIGDKCILFTKDKTYQIDKNGNILKL